MARAKLKDAEILFDKKRYDGSVYLCGYAIEFALKARICATLRWTNGYDVKARDYSSFVTHDLEVLLKLSGRHSSIRDDHDAEWQVVASWTPVSRYQPHGTATRAKAESMIEATRHLLRAL